MTFTNDTREIPLTRGLVALVDAADYEALVAFEWYAVRSKRESVTWYAARAMRSTECGTRASRRLVYMHRQITGAPRSVLVDHRNWNGLNNTRGNLRFATQSQNHMNQRSTRGSSHFLGVTWSLACSKWAAQIKVNGRHIHLGVFSSETEAALARDEASLRYFGDFASLNFPH